MTASVEDLDGTRLPLCDGGEAHLSKGQLALSCAAIGYALSSVVYQVVMADPHPLCNPHGIASWYNVALRAAVVASSNTTDLTHGA